MILYVYHSSVYHVNRLLISTGEMGFSIIPKGTSSGEAAEHSMDLYQSNFELSLL